MAAADYLLCDDCSRKVYYRNVAGHPGDELPDGAVLLCGDCAPKRLVEPGSETREEWAYLIDGQAAPWGASRDRVRAEEKLASHRLGWPDVPGHLVARTVHTGPWRAES